MLLVRAMHATKLQEKEYIPKFASSHLEHTRATCIIIMIHSRISSSTFIQFKIGVHRTHVDGGAALCANATPNSPNFDIVEIEQRLDPTLKQPTWRPHHFWTSCPRSPPPRVGARRSLRRPCSAASPLRLSPRPTSWDACPTGQTSSTPTGLVASSMATATTEVGIRKVLRIQRGPW